MRKSVIIVLAVMLIAGSAFAVVTPDPLFSENAVLQQGMRLPVWGAADAGVKVTVTIQGQRVSAVALPSGNWMVHLKPLKAGGPFTMTINDQEIKNVLVGEVWVCSGQSNMAFQLNRASNGEQAVADSKDPMLRLFLVPKMRDPFTLPKAWTESSPDSSPTFSAVGYFFGKALRKALGVPVGLIDSSVGGTPAEAWTSRSYLSPHPELNGTPKCYYLYNSMIAPLIPYGIRGAIWYQGEGNAGRAYAYRSLLPLMIKCWRDAWGEGEFPFLIVQLAPYGKQKRPDANWPELREAELYVTQTVPNTGLAVTMDVGNCENIHPTQKEPVGERLALDAEAMVYGKKVEYSGPAYQSMSVEESGGIILSFMHAEGLAAVGGELKGFTIAGEDKNFVPATAVIKGDQVIVSSPDVPEPVAVRYGWDDCPDANFANKAGLPASPFRTDDWGWITKPE